MDFAGGLFPMLFTLRILSFTKSERSSRAVVTLVTSRSDRGVMVSRYLPVLMFCTRFSTE